MSSNYINSAVITGIGLVSSQGHTKEKFYDNYLQNSKPVLCERMSQFFATTYTRQVHKAPEIDTQLIPARMRRRLSTLSRMIILSALRCLKDAKLDYQQRDDIGIVVGTGWGETEVMQKLLMQITDEGEIAVSPTLFHNSVHNTAAGYLGIMLGFTGPTLTVSQGEHSFAVALEQGYSLLAMQQSNAVLVGGGDAFFDFSVLSSTDQPDSAGSCFVLLEPETEARKRGATINARCTLLPVRTLNTVEHFATYSQALRHFLAQYRTAIEDIDLIFLAGSATQKLHEREMEMLHAISDHSTYLLFDNRGQHRPTKGVEDLVEMLAVLHHQKLPYGVTRFVNSKLQTVAQEATAEIKKILVISADDFGVHRPILLEVLSTSCRS